MTSFQNSMAQQFVALHAAVENHISNNPSSTPSPTSSVTHPPRSWTSSSQPTLVHPTSYLWLSSTPSSQLFHHLSPLNTASQSPSQPSTATSPTITGPTNSPISSPPQRKPSLATTPRGVPSFQQRTSSRLVDLGRPLHEGASCSGARPRANRHLAFRRRRLGVDELLKLRRPIVTWEEFSMALKSRIAGRVATHWGPSHTSNNSARWRSSSWYSPSYLSTHPIGTIVSFSTSLLVAYIRNFNMMYTACNLHPSKSHNDRHAFSNHPAIPSSALTNRFLPTRLFPPPSNCWYISR